MSNLYKINSSLQDTYSDFDALIAYLQGQYSDGKTLYINSNWSVTNDLTIPDNFILLWGDQGKITIPSGKTLTISSKFSNDPDWQIFDGDGDVSFSAGIQPEPVRVEWWGMYHNDDTKGTENSAAVANAISAVNPTNFWAVIEFLPNRKYYVAGDPGIDINKSKIIVRFNGCSIDYGTETGTCIKVGGEPPNPPAAATTLSNIKIEGILRVQRTYPDSGVPAATALTENGLVIQNLIESEIDSVFATGFKNGIYLYGDGGGVSLNKFTQINTGRCLRAIVLDTSAESGSYLTANSFISGNLSYNATAYDDNIGSRLVLAGESENRSPNGNNFHDMTIETMAERKVDFHFADNNQLIGCYWDPGSYNAARTGYYEDVTGATFTGGSAVISNLSMTYDPIAGDKVKITVAGNSADRGFYSVVSYDDVAGTITLDKNITTGTAAGEFTWYRTNIYFGLNSRNNMIIGGVTLYDNVITDDTRSTDPAVTGPFGRNTVIDAVRGIEMGGADSTLASSAFQTGMFSFKRNAANNVDAFLGNEYDGDGVDPETYKNAGTSLNWQSPDSYGRMRNHTILKGRPIDRDTSSVDGRLNIIQNNVAQFSIDAVRAMIKSKLGLGKTTITDSAYDMLKNELEIDAGIHIGSQGYNKETVHNGGIIAQGGIVCGTKAIVRETNDGSNQLSNWKLYETPSATYYVELTDAAGTRTVDVYDNVAKGAGDKVLTGSLVGDGSITLAEANSSGFSGYVTVAYTGDDTDIQLAVTNQATPSAIFVNNSESTGRAAMELYNFLADADIGWFSENDAQRWVMYMPYGADSDCILIKDLTNSKDKLIININTGDIVFKNSRIVIESPSADALVIGSGVAATDYKLTFDGDDSDGTITHMEDEARFDLNQDLKAAGWVKQEGIFAGLHTHDNTATQSIPTGTTYTKCTLWTADDDAANCTPDYANDKITITHAGYYRVTGSFSFASGTANVEWYGAAFLNGVEWDNVHWVRKVSNANDIGCASFVGIIDVTSAPLDLDFRVRHGSGGSVNFELFYGNMNVEYIGET